jgi:hypothetical protein
MHVTRVADVDDVELARCPDRCVVAELRRLEASVERRRIVALAA